MPQSKKDTIKKCAIKFAVLLFWTGVWQLAFILVSRRYGEILLVSPLGVISRLKELAVTGKFWQDTLTSLLRIMLGYFSGIAVAVISAVLMAKSSFIKALLSPIFSLIKTTPVTSFILLALVWIKKDSVAVFISFLMVLPLIRANVSQGIEQTDKAMLEMAKVFGFSPLKKLRTVYFHSVMPYFVSGCTTALGFAWKAGIAAEVLSTPIKSIGYNLYRAKINIETADLFAWTCVVIILSVIIEKTVTAVLRSFERRGEKNA